MFKSKLTKKLMAAAICAIALTNPTFSVEKPIA